MFWIYSGYADVTQSVVRRIGSAEVTGPIPSSAFSLTAEDWSVQLPLILSGVFSFYRREFVMEAKINVEYPSNRRFLPTGKNSERSRKEKGLEGEGYCPVYGDF